MALLLQIQFAQKTDKVGKRESQQSDGKIGSGKRLERDKLDRVEKGKKVLHGIR